MKNNWKSLDTAPKDGKAFIGFLAFENGVWEIQIVYFYKGRFVVAFDLSEADHLKLWDDLPSPPSPYF